MIPNITVQSNTLKEANGMGLTTSIKGVRFRLTISAFLLLFVELALIRWLGANIVYLAYFSNFVLIGSFLGIGLGFLWASRSERSLFPLAPFFLSGFIIFVRLFDVNIEVGGSDLIFFADQRPVGPPRWFILTVVFCVVAACVSAAAGRALGPTQCHLGHNKAVGTHLATTRDNNLCHSLEQNKQEMPALALGQQSLSVFEQEDRAVHDELLGFIGRQSCDSNIGAWRGQGPQLRAPKPGRADGKSIR